MPASSSSMGSTRPISAAVVNGGDGISQASGFSTRRIQHTADPAHGGSSTRRAGQCAGERGESGAWRLATSTPCARRKQVLEFIPAACSQTTATQPNQTVRTNNKKRASVTKYDALDESGTNAPAAARGWIGRLRPLA
eukprot:3454124-Prymnesium_polylepis.1